MRIPEEADPESTGPYLNDPASALDHNDYFDLD
jgi:hypothetical protein